jgi:hypothetical protein
MSKPQADNPENPLHHIERHDMEVDGINDWQVAVMRNSITISKRFSDGKYGGRGGALQAAIRYRDELLAQTDLFAHQMWLRSVIRRNNTSGIPGVTRCEQRDKRSPNSRYVFWAARWTDEFGIGRLRSFSVLRFGEQEAKQLAIAEREFQLKRVCVAKGSHWSDPFCSQNKKPKPQAPDV